MMTHLHTYRPLRAALALALLVSAALPTLRYACDVIGETTEVSVAVVADHAGPSAMPVCERGDEQGHERGPCAEGDCTMTAEEARSPASLSNAPRPVPQPLVASALLTLAQEPDTDAPDSRAGASHENATPERVPVRLRTSTYLL